MNSFRRVTLSEITINLDKLRVPLSSIVRSKLDKKYPYYGAQNIVDYVDNYIFDGEYLLVAEDGENLKSQNANVCNYVTGKFWVNNHAHILQAKDGHNLKYIYYLLNLIDFRPFVTGSAQPKLTQDNLSRIELLVHEPAIQNRIASILSALDFKIELNNQITAKLEAMAKLLYSYWFVQFDFPNHKGKPYKTNGGKMFWCEELKMEIPQGWKSKRLAELTCLLARGVSPKYTESGGISVLNQKCIRNRSINFALGRRHDNLLKNVDSKIIEVGDVLVNSTGVGTLGRTAIVNRLDESQITTDSHVTIVRIDAKKANKYYAGYTISNKENEIEQLGEGSTGQTELSRDNLGNLKIVIPPDDLQLAFESFFKPQLEKMANNERENQKLSQLRDWLLPMLMNGQISVSDMNEELAMAAEPLQSYPRIKK